MKRGIIILLVALFAGVSGFVVTRQHCCCTASDATAHDGGSLLPELEWLHHELNLTDEQFAKVKERHLAYRPFCEAMCRKVGAAHQKVRALADSGDIASPELAAALQEQANVHAECQMALLKHLHSTAAVMSPAQAQHYLEVMLPQVIGAEAGGH